MKSQPSEPPVSALPCDHTESLSALIDGECQAHELDALLAAGCRSARRRISHLEPATWRVGPHCAAMA